MTTTFMLATVALFKGAVLPIRKYEYTKSLYRSKES